MIGGPILVWRIKTISHSPQRYHRAHGKQAGSRLDSDTGNWRCFGQKIATCRAASVDQKNELKQNVPLTMERRHIGDLEQARRGTWGNIAISLLTFEEQ